MFGDDSFTLPPQQNPGADFLKLLQPAGTTGFVVTGGSSGCAFYQTNQGGRCALDPTWVVIGLMGIVAIIYVMK